ncbi:hypothetical protein AAFF_G00102560 [Aldrovandia affinis]|uniref:Uncharacterized protein n=1 Tax=Aldrovandia affinis TaxID=143900 RepID=A0AAD7RUU5_9TELE|nr:hypothetical protein AAFF_G00102560 [Aldrovandia affinis]
MLMVMLFWVSFSMDLDLSLPKYHYGADHIHHNHGRVRLHASSVKAVDILWASFLFVFLSVTKYAAVTYCTTVEEMKKLKRGKMSACAADKQTPSRNSTKPLPVKGTKLCWRCSIRDNIKFIMSNSYVIGSCSLKILPLAYLLFNLIYWCMYS